MSSQTEIRRRITDQIVAALKDGTRLPPWKKPWRDDNAGQPSPRLLGGFDFRRPDRRDIEHVQVWNY